ncbi:hypothetical protein CYMTET_54477 [Cymbomonas tetramitiformis]|uniref:Uncharacterized protein n=1 Tax=Cymbomonas tetramitiformis TaxID=36881 RepID=A0AAE0EPJ3_9CHLO|nr:hypothetical protein CYMTET_54477 [Cymbomonas tetramitiformis]
MASAVISKSKSLISGLVSASSAVVEPAAKGLVSGNEQFVVKESGLLQKFIYSNLAEIPATLSKARAELAAATPAVNVGEMTVAQAGGVAYIFPRKELANCTGVGQNCLGVASCTIFEGSRKCLVITQGRVNSGLIESC